MARASSKVIEGEFKGKYVFYLYNNVFIVIQKRPLIGSMRRLFLNSSTIANYELVDYSSDVSLASAMARGAMGKMAAGDIGGIAGAMTAKNHGVNIVLITFKDGKKSLIEIDDRTYEGLKKCCLYNVKFDDSVVNHNDFDIHREIKCPHCKNIAYGAVEEKCPFCGRLYSIQSKELQTIDKIIMPLLILIYPVGLIMMWLNKSYYKDTRIKFTIIFGILFIIIMLIGLNSSKSINESNSINNEIVIEYDI